MCSCPCYCTYHDCCALWQLTLQNANYNVRSLGLLRGGSIEDCKLKGFETTYPHMYKRITSIQNLVIKLSVLTLKSTEAHGYTR